MGRSVNEIAAELNSTGLTQQQLTLLVELITAKTEEPAPPAKRSRKPPLILIPEDWTPSPAHFEWATEHGKGTSWVHGVADDMRNWAASRGERRACWNGTFSTFLKRALEPRPVQQKLFNGHANGKSMLGGGYA